MAIDMSAGTGPVRRRSGKASIEYKLIFAVTFLVFLVATVAERLMPWRWLSASRDGHRASVFGKARDAAQTCTTYAFMG